MNHLQIIAEVERLAAHAKELEDKVNELTKKPFVVRCIKCGTLNPTGLLPCAGGNEECTVAFPVCKKCFRHTDRVICPKCLETLSHPPSTSAPPPPPQSQCSGGDVVASASSGGKCIWCLGNATKLACCSKCGAALAHAWNCDHCRLNKIECFRCDKPVHA